LLCVASPSHAAGGSDAVAAEKIFSVGQELREFIVSGKRSTRRKFRVGMPDVVRKLIAFEMLRPALRMSDRPRIICNEGKLQQLLADLALHRLDLTKRPSGSSSKPEAGSSIPE
jgi:LysR family transcriptional activator of nhaA